MRRGAWRVLMTPDTHVRRLTPAGMAYALDNGAWGAFQRGEPWDRERFDQMCAAWASAADWIVLPDIVAGGAESLALSLSWKARITVPRLRLIAVQDGMTPDDVAPHVDGDCGIFVGGSTDWKLDTMSHWGRLAQRRGCYLHIARVNTVRRIIRCQDVGAHSFDGTSPSRFSVTTPRLTAAVKQGHLFTSEY